MTKSQLLEKLNKRQERSAWKRGVKTYAIMMIDNFEKMPGSVHELREMCLNGASSFEEASYGGVYLIYDSDICNMLCTPSEIKRKRSGELNPNSRETWLDVQALAINQAFCLLRYLMF